MRIYFLIALISASLIASGQNMITGIVVDSTDFSALASVNIQVKNQKRGTVSDEKGNFSILATLQDTLEFTRVGYKTLEFTPIDYEPGIIRLSQQYTLLKAVTIDELKQNKNPYEGMFEEQNARLKKSIPFYFSKAKKEKIKVQSLKEENLRVKTYIDVVINNPETKIQLMAKYGLAEDAYYLLLTKFNEKHYRVMYYLTPAELISLLNTFYESGTKN